jgi:hypothetical protein
MRFWFSFCTARSSFSFRVGMEKKLMRAG